MRQRNGRRALQTSATEDLAKANLMNEKFVSLARCNMSKRSVKGLDGWQNFTRPVPCAWERMIVPDWS